MTNNNSQINIPICTFALIIILIGLIKFYGGFNGLSLIIFIVGCLSMILPTYISQSEHIKKNFWGYGIPLSMIVIAFFVVSANPFCSLSSNFCLVDFVISIWVGAGAIIFLYFFQRGKILKNLSQNMILFLLTLESIGIIMLASFLVKL